MECFKTMDAVASIDKAIDVLFYLHGSSSDCGVTSIARGLEIPKSSVHRLLAALVRGGLVDRTQTGQYRPGVGLLALGLGVLDREPVVEAGHRVLEEFAQRWGETLFLVAARGGDLRVLDKVEGQGFLRAAPRIGSSVPVHATAVGKLYLAFSDESVAVAMENGREAFTRATLTESMALHREIQEIRDLGVAWNREEWISGLFVVAAPIHGPGQMRAAVAMALPASRLPELGEELLATEIRLAAQQISERVSGVRRGSTAMEKHNDD
ncbi:MAG: hypothetical protein CL917_12730 [Deltaproteobacteria bacterium]|nr:hypothetical protein [Deltaproteobacteria bacterium]